MPLYGCEHASAVSGRPSRGGCVCFALIMDRDHGSNDKMMMVEAARHHMCVAGRFACCLVHPPPTCTYSSLPLARHSAHMHAERCRAYGTTNDTRCVGSWAPTLESSLIASFGLVCLSLLVIETMNRMNRKPAQCAFSTRDQDNQPNVCLSTWPTPASPGHLQEAWKQGLLR